MPISLLAVLLVAASTAPSAPARLAYAVRLDTTGFRGVAVEMRISRAPGRATLASHAHPEYDDRYWRNVEALSASDAAGRPVAVVRIDSTRWQLANRPGDVTVRYRVAFPDEGSPRSPWKPFVSGTGALLGGPHSFLYVIGLEEAGARVTLDVPASWKVATGLRGTSASRSFAAPDMFTLMESPIFAGMMSEWSFTAGGVPHRIFYWRQPTPVPFDTVSFVSGVERLVRTTIELFGGAPYDDYTFIFQDGAWGGGLEHPNSVTLGAPSADIARTPHAVLPEVAHEFIHTWNLMAIRPAEYRRIDWRTQPPVAGLWFSEGLTIFYADLLRRRAGLPVAEPTRVQHLATLIERYLGAPGNARYSAEAVSRVAYNAAPDALGDYSASSHLQGEILGNLLDLRIRGATGGRRSMDDVMRLMYRRHTDRGFTGRDVQRAVESTCRCSAADIFDGHVRSGTPIDFDHHLAAIGLRLTQRTTPAADGDGRPLRDLRVWAWQDSTGALRLRVTNPSSIWGEAGLRTGDVITAVNGTPVRTWPEFRAILGPLQIGDAVAITVVRAAGTITARVVMRGYTTPSVTIEAIPEAPATARALREQWESG